MPLAKGRSLDTIYDISAVSAPGPMLRPPLIDAAAPRYGNEIVALRSGRTASADRLRNMTLYFLAASTECL